MGTDVDTMFSIVMPMFNASATLRESVESVIGQTYKNWELLIVNDQSTDNSAVIAATFVQQDSRIKLINQEVNSGVAGARNAAIRCARGRYLCFLDADDKWLESKLTTQFEAFQHGAKIVFSSYFRLFPDGRLTRVRARPKVSFFQMHLWNPIGNLTGAYDTVALGRQEQIKHGHEDYIMWHALVKKAGLAVGLPEELAVYRVGIQSVSSSKVRAAQWQWSILRKQFGLSLASAVVCFIAYCFNAFGQRMFPSAVNQSKGGTA